MASNPNSHVYFYPNCMDCLSRKYRVIPTYDTAIIASLSELDLNPDIMAKLQFSETFPWTYLTPIINLILSLATKDQRDPSIYMGS